MDDNRLAKLCEPVQNEKNGDQIAEQMVCKLQLISSIHAALLTNVEAAQEKQFHRYATHEGKQLFAELQVEAG
jgi:hypothetical protein